MPAIYRSGDLPLPLYTCLCFIQKVTCVCVLSKLAYLFLSGLLYWAYFSFCCWDLFNFVCFLNKRDDCSVLKKKSVKVNIPNEVISRNQNRWDDFIIGQFHGKAPSPGALHAITNGIWSNKRKDISVSKLSERAFLIKIPCSMTRKRVLAQGMWHIEKQSMFVAKWVPGIQPVIPELKTAPVWLDFHHVPLQFYSEEGLEHIAGALGKPLFLHPFTANMTNLEVARVYTIVDLTKPLPEAVNVRFDSGHIQRVAVTSPWLPPTCDHCQEVGHNIKRCPTAPITCSECNSTGHAVEVCPRTIKIDADSKKETGIKKRKKRKQNKKKAILEGGSLEIDIGLDKLNLAKTLPPKKKVVPVQSEESSPESSDASEAITVSEAESTDCSSDQEDDNSVEEEESFTPVVSKRNQKLQLQQKKQLQLQQQRQAKIVSAWGKGPKTY